VGLLTLLLTREAAGPACDIVWLIMKPPLTRAAFGLIVFTIASSFGTLIGYAQEGIPQLAQSTPAEIQDKRDLSKFGSVNLNAEQIRDPREWERRRQISQRYDNQEWVYKVINSPQAAGVGKINDDELPPLFPVDESDLIVVGKVVKVNAFLSNDKRGVYSEFTIRVQDTLKNVDKKNTDTSEIVADREGGVVVYPNGQRILYQNSNLGLPRLGSEYLLFLKKDPSISNYMIRTSYDLSSSSVVLPVELGFPFDEYKFATKAGFVDMVRSKIRNAHTGQ
jgi:hypothetical protein